MSRKKVGRASRSKSRKLLYALSSQIQKLNSKCLLQAKFDQAVLKDLIQVTFEICNFEDQVSLDTAGSKQVTKEDRALRGLLNQIEERIELIAKHRAEDFVNQNTLASTFGQDSKRGSTKPPPSAASTLPK